MNAFRRTGRMVKFTHAVPFSRGFTIIELVVAIAIFVTLTGILLFNYNNFNKRMTVDTLAHQIAQWVRDAQVSAMSVRSAKTAAGNFTHGFGLHFDRATPDRFVFFADLNGNQQYDPSGTCGSVGDECEQEIQILQGNTIKKLCGQTNLVGAVTSADCVSPLPPYNADDLDIVFTRPSADADITGNNAPSTPAPYSPADIVVGSPSGYEHTIEVWATGQVSVK